MPLRATEEKKNGFPSNKVTLWSASYSACVVYIKTIIHLSVGESGGYLPPLRWIIVNYVPLIHNFRVWASDKCAIIFILLWSRSIQVKNVQHSTRGQNMQARTVDVIKGVNHSCREGQAKEWEVLCSGRPGLVSYINTTWAYTEGIVMHMFPKENVRRAQC